MASYEVQANLKTGWQIVALFDGYEEAFECTLQLDRDRIYDDMRIRREVEDPRTGRYRATTVYRGGQKIRDEIAREEEEIKKLAAAEKRQVRLNRKIMPRWIRKSDKARVRLADETNPIRIALWTTLLFSAGMTAVYYFEFVLTGK